MPECMKNKYICKEEMKKPTKTCHLLDVYCIYVLDMAENSSQGLKS